MSKWLLSQVFSEIYIGQLEPNTEPNQPLVVYSNHPSFWDPLICGKVLTTLYPGRSIYAPIDQESLRKFWYFQGLGFFSLKLDSLSGLRTFLKVGRAILEEVDSPCLVITPEGRFTEPTDRPIHLKRGLSKLLSGSFERGVDILPLAIDYRLGSEPKPIAWVTTGKLLSVKPGTVMEQKLLHSILEKRLTEAMDENLCSIQGNHKTKAQMEAKA